ncbi:MAG: preprotein translocase subunit SecA [Chloroflexi bacterium]|nr:preprotein translocase subunit SecA [Chloroflexota bacterium]MBM4449468.1 preprotein translocase subunit SecA [Chloroflexota bacterium]
MLKWLASLTDSNEKEIKRLQPTINQINSLEPDFQKLSDAELRAKTVEFKSRLKDGETLDDLLPEAFAATREAASRTIGQRHYDVQLMGGIVLHQGKIAEMKTGEGKTLVATLPLYLKALTGQGCHLVTVNDYLARRDAYWMGPIYHALGLTVASIYPPQSPTEQLPARLYDPSYTDEKDTRWTHFKPITRQDAYKADITYGTNNEFGFDYLRDNMAIDLSQQVQRPLNYAIVDEVDNILIDEARTPLIISGTAEEATKKYEVFARLVPLLKQNEDYTIEERERTVYLTDSGITKMESWLRKEGLLKAPSLYDPANYSLNQYMENALKAQVLFKRDRDYVVKDSQVIIVDEFTGRLMFGRRYSEGLHQAIEAKERVKIQRESVTLATITFQNYFRLYEKLAGMTGTATTEAEEFYKIYKLDVVTIPTHKPMIRIDHPDQIYKDEDAKFKAAAREIEEFHKQGRPVLIGTVSIEISEQLSELLKRRGIPHQVLNAKNHEKEAAIIAQAGRLGAVTVATNMAGRGVDIILGGIQDSRDPQDWQQEHDRVVQLGGLHVVGTERHEARRIDNQLRGRSGRQGDPGSSRFYVSLEDDVARRFGGDRIKGIMSWAGFDENTPIEHPMVSKAIENAQMKVEGFHFDIRKHLVEYDDIVNKHREVIYAERRKVLEGADLRANILSMAQDEIGTLVSAHCNNELLEPDYEGLLAELTDIFPLPTQINAAALSKTGTGEITEKLTDHAERLYEQKEQELGPQNMRLAERVVMLRTIDSLWKDHLTAMDHLRQRVGLHAVSQVNPLVMYKKEGHALFQSLLDSIQHDVARIIYKVNVTVQEPQQQRLPQKMAVPAGKKVGRNEPCPCGSGKKYKHCCGR